MKVKTYDEFREAIKSHNSFIVQRDIIKSRIKAIEEDMINNPELYEDDVKSSYISATPTISKQFNSIVENSIGNKYLNSAKNELKKMKNELTILELNIVEIQSLLKLLSLEDRFIFRLCIEGNMPVDIQKLYHKEFGEIKHIDLQSMKGRIYRTIKKAYKKYCKLFKV